jgi:hypothetical protein
MAMAPTSSSPAVLELVPTSRTHPGLKQAVQFHLPPPPAGSPSAPFRPLGRSVTTTGTRRRNEDPGLVRAATVVHSDGEYWPQHSASKSLQWVLPSAARSSSPAAKLALPKPASPELASPRPAAQSQEDNLASFEWQSTLELVRGTRRLAALAEEPEHRPSLFAASPPVSARLRPTSAVSTCASTTLQGSQGFDSDSASSSDSETEADTPAVFVDCFRGAAQRRQVLGKRGAPTLSLRLSDISNLGHLQQLPAVATPVVAKRGAEQTERSCVQAAASEALECGLLLYVPPRPSSTKLDTPRSASKENAAPRGDKNGKRPSLLRLETFRFPKMKPTAEAPRSQPPVAEAPRPTPAVDVPRLQHTHRRVVSDVGTRPVAIYGTEALQSWLKPKTTSLPRSARDARMTVAFA